MEEERETICRIVRADSLDSLFPLLDGYGKVWIVCDENVWDRVGRPIAERLAVEPISLRGVYMSSGKFLGGSLIDAREENKTMATVETIVGDMLESGADRSVLVLGIGGGITTDIAGFAASIYKRGVRFAFVPTTLLAQVDAAIGGKNGVNFHSFKNMLGIIRQPEFTYVYPEPLRTLSREALLSGVSEMLKTFIIADSEAYGNAVTVLKEWTGRLGVKPCDATDGSALAGADSLGFGSHEAGIGRLAARAAEIKASIVERDPEEHGLRRVLNLGHTFAHAIETLSGGKWAHGLAVAIGIVAAARLAERLSGKMTDAEGRAFVCEDGLSSRLEADFRDIGLPTECPFGMMEMSAVISKDKKADGNRINFILPTEIGSVKTVRLDIVTLTEKGI